MKFDGTERFDLDKEQLWELISDPEVLATSIPDAKQVDRLSETKYQTTLEKSVMRFTVTLATNVELVTMNPPTKIVAVAEGVDTDAQSSYLPSRGMEAEATLEMEESEDGRTALHYHIDMEFSGPHVELAAKAIKKQIESDIDTFFDNIREYDS